MFHPPACSHHTNRIALIHQYGIEQENSCPSALYLKACPRFCYYGCWLFLPLKGDHDPVASRDIGRNSNHPPTISSHAVHLSFRTANSIDFNTILVHRLFLLGAILIRAAHEQSEQRSEQKASAQEAAMMIVMMAMAAMAAKDHVSKSKGSKQTQHCDVPPFRSFSMYRLFGTCTG